MNPDVLVLDEPAAGLDPRGRKEILSGLKEYVRESGTTLILVSHSMEDMAYYCDNVVVMNDGKVYREGSVAEIFSMAEDLSAVGLDIPMVSRIASALKKCGIELNGELYTVDGVKNAILDYIGRSVN
jgi:energy-coupling factor transport system ATP-binding protein